MLKSSNEGQCDLANARNQPQRNSLPCQRGVGVGVQWEVRTVSLIFSFLVLMKGYQWLKERVNSEEGRRQLAKIKELHLLADRLGCTAAQLAIGTTQTNCMILQCRQAYVYFVIA